MSDFSRTPLRERLRNGAKVVGAHWKSGKRCASGWSVSCECPEKTSFCKAKEQWLALAVQDASDEAPRMGDGPYGLVEMMRASEADAMGLPVSVEIDGVGVLRVGSKGELSARDLAALSFDPASARGILTILSKFKGSKLSGPLPDLSTQVAPKNT